MRSRQGAIRRLEERRRIYFEVKRLVRSGLSYPQVGRRLGIHRDMARRYNLRTTAPMVERYNPDLSPSPDLAYLIGFWLGDGRDAVGEKKVRFKLADKQQLEYVNRVTAKLLDRAPKPIRMEGTFCAVDYDSSRLYDYLAQPLEGLMPCIEAYPSRFLRGFFDAEGYISCSPTPSRRVIVILGVANTNRDYLYLVERFLLNYGIIVVREVTNKAGGLMRIRGRTFVRRHDVCHLATSSRESIRRFSQEIGFANAAKASRLSDFVALFGLSPEERYRWFMAHYVKLGGKWARIGKSSLKSVPRVGRAAPRGRI